MFVRHLQHVPIKQIFRRYASDEKYHCCKLLVVGGGTGGTSVAWRLRKIFKESTIVLEPSEVHYYQPGYTLIGSGLKEIGDCQKLTAATLPQSASWIQDSAEFFDPCNNMVYTKLGRRIKYEFMVIAMGLENNYGRIRGLQQALEDPYSKVSTIYSPDHCQKTWDLLQQFCGGEALFTFPELPVKCPGAAMKIAYLAQDYWRIRNLLRYTNMTYNTAYNDTMTVPIYAIATRNLLLQKKIGINYCFDLIEVQSNTAVFMDSCGTPYSLPFDFLHVTPHMNPPAALRNCQLLVDPCGFLDIDHYTLQHNSFKNVFGLGDCTCTPNNKTAAAVAAQSLIVAKNVKSAVNGMKPTAKYDGYGACPIITSYTHGIMAEYLYDGKLAHTFPFDQTKERYMFFEIVYHVFPRLYWYLTMKGMWSGPRIIRKIFNPLQRSSTATATKSYQPPAKLIDIGAMKKKLIRKKENVQLFVQRCCCCKKKK